MSKITAQTWAVAHILVLVLVTGSAFPLVASAEQDHYDHEQGQNESGEGHHNNESDEDTQGPSGGDDTPVGTTATVIATKIVCDNEADLPNWGVGTGAHITLSTATDYVAAHPTCHLTSGWSFEWAPESATNPGDNAGATGDAWTAFGPTVGNGTASTQIPSVASGVITWFREVFQTGYVSFTGPSDVNNVSAEFYCDTDHTNYDNFDWIIGAQANQTYYCVAFNALLAPVDPSCTESQHLENHVCVENGTGGGSGTGTTTPTASSGSSSGGPSNIIAGGGGDPRGQVLGVSCGLYMDKHIKFGSTKNDRGQVTKLQTFLNKWMGTTLAVTGLYDRATLTVLNAFQQQYADEILAPWEVTKPTGLVYLSTVRKINLLECPALMIPTPELVPWNLNPTAQ